ncbi:MAG: YicC family protein, partial [Bacteroidetes bacterium]|nr:YicC family protein [Bacteroidota bacterium]
MLQSMTGYGRAEERFDEETLSVEIKSLNSKNLDLSVRLPQALRTHELNLRKRLSDTIIRGKVEVYVQLSGQQLNPQSQLNQEVINRYLEQINAIAEGDRLSQLALALRLPDAVSQEKEVLEDQSWEAKLFQVADRAVEAFHAFRTQEGKELQEDILSNLRQIESGLGRINTLDSERTDNQRTKLREAIDTLEQKIDENRFEQELIYYIEKFDINEERVRLKNHIDYFQTTLAEEAVGKKLGFIAQELGREINTIGSKANHSGIQREVVQMKDALE